MHMCSIIVFLINFQIFNRYLRIVNLKYCCENKCINHVFLIDQNGKNNLYYSTFIFFSSGHGF